MVRMRLEERCVSSRLITTYGWTSGRADERTDEWTNGSQRGNMPAKMPSLVIRAPAAPATAPTITRVFQPPLA